MFHCSCWALLLLLEATLTFAGQSSPKPQESFAPYWTSEPGWTTELQLKNNLPSTPLTVTPVLRLASGQGIPLDATTIPPNSSVSVWVNEGLLAHASDLLSQPGSYGSVVFRYTSLSAVNLYATVLLSIHGEPISFPILALPASSSPRGNGLGSLEGIWWQPRTGLNDVLVIGNHSDAKVSGSLSLFDASGKQWSQPLTLGPHQTQRMATSDLVQKAGLTGNYGGISFAAASSVSAVDAFHFVYDETSKYSASLELFRRDPNATLAERSGRDAKHWTMRAPMLALHNPDPALALPRGTELQPTIFVRNTTAKSITADMALTWRSDSTKGQVKLPNLQLAPFATQQIQIGPMQQLLQIPADAHWALVSLTTAALPDDLIAVATSIDASGRYNLDTRFAGGIGGHHFAGGEWSADANHNQLMAVTNTGQKTTNALLTLHYDKGEKKYELQQTIAPDDQMWINLSQLIRNRVADRNGNTLPVDVKTVTYELRDLSPGVGNLHVGALALDNTFGFSAIPPPCPSCCPLVSIAFDSGFLDLPVGTTDPVGIVGINQCTNGSEVLTPDFTTWGSDNVGIAKASYAKVQATGPGSTTVYAGGYVNGPGECECSPVFQQPTLPVNVLSFKATGKNYIFVGTDPNELYGNHYTLTDSTGTQNPQPAGGTCCAASSDASDTYTQTGSNPPIIQFTTLDQSAAAGDRTLTFEYDLPDGGGTSQQINVTAREFAYATNNSPSNTCTLGYGTNRTYTYTVYTHPDHASVLSTDGVSGTAVSEAFNPSLTCETITGNGSLNTSAQFADNITSVCSSKPLTCSQTSTQTIKVAGYPIRTNTLQWTSTGVTYTNDGPTQ